MTRRGMQHTTLSHLRATVLGLAALATLGACSEDGAVTPMGGAGFESQFTQVSQVRYPGMFALAFGRTVNNASVVDSLVGEVSLTKPLDGKARYQFFLVNGLDSTAVPVSHRQWVIRTDTLLDAAGNLSNPVDTSKLSGVKDFWRGAFYGQRLRFAVTLSAADSAQQRGAWLVLTIQSDTTRSAFNDTTPRPLFLRFRDQKGTVTRDDDVIVPDTLRATFGDFLSPTRQVAYASGGTGSLLFWDVAKTGKPAMRVELANVRKPPRGYFYQPFVIDSLTGVAYAWSDVTDAAFVSLFNADLRSDSVLAVVRGINPSSDVIGQPENYTRVDLILEPKAAPPALTTGLSIYSLMSVLRAPIPSGLAAKRAALGTLSVVVTKTTLGGAPAPNVGVVVQASGNNFNTLVGNKNTDSTGTATFTGMPPGALRVIAIPFGGSLVETRSTITSGQTTTARLVVP
ncbi:MAG: carboxypeptidase regulatory-like domain-containing protein [Gemmatimonadaceae bacterium]|nr:carboxypeptidase regulatory-like domain-containing protein [Gemmatimonadaceae bacterium]